MMFEFKLLRLHKKDCFTQPLKKIVLQLGVVQ